MRKLITNHTSIYKKKFDMRKDKMNSYYVHKLFHRIKKDNPLPIQTQFKYSNLCFQDEIQGYFTIMRHLDDSIAFCDKNLKRLYQYPIPIANTSVFCTFYHEFEHANQNFLAHKLAKRERLNNLEEMYASAILMAQLYRFNLNTNAYVYLDSNNIPKEDLTHYDGYLKYLGTMVEFFAEISACEQTNSFIKKIGSTPMLNSFFANYKSNNMVTLNHIIKYNDKLFNHFENLKVDTLIFGSDNPSITKEFLLEKAKQFWTLVKIILSRLTQEELNEPFRNNSKTISALADLIPHRSFLRQDKDVLEGTYQDIAKKIIKKHFPENSENDFTRDE